ncbi:cobalamin biosynthesis protein CobD [Candidatus Bipolaricaulota bacterium]|nr:cobalamin biosynthesis protein CobD [Candidatus Bipolaricaulota bacterium]
MNLYEYKLPASLAVLLGSLILDLLVGEPPEALHPVVWIGRAIDLLKSQLGKFDNGKLAGSLLVVLVSIGSGGLAYFFLELIAVPWAPLGVLIGIYLTKSTISIRSLVGTARDIGRKIKSKTEQAREQLIALVGRNRSKLSKGEMRSATIESLFENLVDSVITPYFYFFLGSLVNFKLGVAFAMTYKGVNTVDSMLGYKEGDLLDFGYFGARLDDLLNWLPSRLAIGFISLAAFALEPAIVAFREWHVSPSPNSGWPMAAAAAALKVKLIKKGSYTLGKDYELPGPKALPRAISLAWRTIGLYLVLLIVLLFILW